MATLGARVSGAREGADPDRTWQGWDEEAFDGRTDLLGPEDLDPRRSLAGGRGEQPEKGEDEEEKGGAKAMLILPTGHSFSVGTPSPGLSTSTGTQPMYVWRELERD